MILYSTALYSGSMNPLFVLVQVLCIKLLVKLEISFSVSP